MKKMILSLVILFSSLAYSYDMDWKIGADPIIRQKATPTAMDAATVAAFDTNDTATIILDSETTTLTGIDFRFRISGGAENAVNVLEHYVYVSSNSGGDFWIHVATHTITQGTQLYSTGIYFADTIADTNGTWYHTLAPFCPTNSIAIDPWETFGFRYHLFICTSLTASNIIYIDYRRW